MCHIGSRTCSCGGNHQSHKDQVIILKHLDVTGLKLFTSDLEFNSEHFTEEDKQTKKVLGTCDV